MPFPALTMTSLLRGSWTSTTRLLSAVPLLRLLVLHLLRLPFSAEHRSIEKEGGEREDASQKAVATDAGGIARSQPSPENDFFAMAATKSRVAASLLTLPLEIRLEIYSYLLLLPSYSEAQDAKPEAARVYPALLAACRQIYAEATPVLYGANSWQAHLSLLTSLPRLRACYSPVVAPAPLTQIRRWRLRMRLDADCPFTTEAATEALTGMEEVVLQIWQATFWGGTGVEVLERLEGVRGVRKVRISGSTKGYEGYLRWLAGSMIAPVGKEVGKYVPVNETERKRLRGWS